MSEQFFVASHASGKERVRVQSLGGGRFAVELGGKLHAVDAHRFEAGTWSILVDGISHDVELELAEAPESHGSYNALVDGEVVQLRVRDERLERLGVTAKRFKATGPTTITAPMPGKVVAVRVRAGDIVQEGQALVVIEAMKMENELSADRAGKVVAILITPGQAVEAGAKLVTME